MARGDGHAIHLRAASGERPRFTIADEDRPFPAPSGARRVERGGATNRATASLEREADQFAAELLMPEPLVRQAALDDGADARRLADRFDVSAQAMRLRLRHLGLVERHGGYRAPPEARRPGPSQANGASGRTPQARRRAGAARDRRGARRPQVARAQAMACALTSTVGEAARVGAVVEHRLAHEGLGHEQLGGELVGLALELGVAWLVGPPRRRPRARGGAGNGRSRGRS